MKKVYTYLFLLFLAPMAFAQLSVQPNGSLDNYMYVDGTVLYVEDEITLTENNAPGNANIYLRNESQLVQGSSSTSNNTGTGSLSVFQEGTSNAYHYNYWGSPVGSFQAGDGTGNVPFSVTSLGVPNSVTGSNSASFTTANNGTTSTGANLTISSNWIYKYVSTSSTQFADWIYVGTARNINAGEGFTMKGVQGTDIISINGVQNNPTGSNQRYDFRGRPNDGTITVPVTSAGENILVANPYPSAIDLNYFLLLNSGTGTLPTNCTGGASVSQRNAISGVAYFWDSDNSVSTHYLAEHVGGYGVYTTGGSCTGSGVYTQAPYNNYDNDGNIEGTPGAAGTATGVEKEARRFSPIGQGFFVESASSGTLESIEFNNEMRTYVEEAIANNSYFDKWANSTDSNDEDTSADSNGGMQLIRFNFAFDDVYTRQIALGFKDNATTGVDRALDGKILNPLSSDAGFLHGLDSYAIDIRPFNVDDRLPLYFTLSEQKDIEVKVNNMENFNVDEVYLYDKDTETYHSIKNNSFLITLPAGNYSERFEITFEDGTDESLNTANEIAESFNVFQDNKLAQLEVLNPNNEDVKAISIFDMTGKEVITSNKLGNSNQFTISTANLSEAVYIVRIVTQDNVISTRKISVLNRG